MHTVFLISSGRGWREVGICLPLSPFQPPHLLLIDFSPPPFGGVSINIWRSRAGLELIQPSSVPPSLLCLTQPQCVCCRGGSQTAQWGDAGRRMLTNSQKQDLVLDYFYQPAEGSNGSVFFFSRRSLFLKIFFSRATLHQQLQSGVTKGFVLLSSSNSSWECCAFTALGWRRSWFRI